MKKLLLFIAMLTIIGLNKVFSQNVCTNADFSASDFSGGWTGSFGNNNNGVYSPTSGIVIGTPNALPSTNGQQTIMNQQGTDPNTSNVLNVIPPGGSSSCRLGNDQVEAEVGGNYQGAQLKYTFIVTNTNCIFTYQYAVVLQDLMNMHPTHSKPKFIVNVKDTAGNLIDSVCGKFEVNTWNVSGFVHCLPEPSVYAPTDTVAWKDWTTVSIDLSPWIGNPVSVEFLALDCSQGAHFGYAYIACSCGSMQIAQQCSGTTDILIAPSGFASYLWTPGGQTTQSITDSSAVFGTAYNCVCATLTGCTDTLKANCNCLSTMIQEYNTKDIILISPNPGNNIIAIAIQQPLVDNMKIEILNSVGQVIKTLAASGNKTSIDVSAFPSGVYVVQVKTDKGIAVRKFIKE